MPAATYTRTYVFKGQTNTSGTRSVPLARFTIDENSNTTHDIRRILAISYEHYHKSSGQHEYQLKGRLRFTDAGGADTCFDTASDIRWIKANTVKYTNTWTRDSAFDVPTNELALMFNDAESRQNVFVETLCHDTTAKVSNSAYTLKWEATTDTPMKLIVTFNSEIYNPTIEELTAWRVDNNGINPQSDGERIKVKLRLNYNPNVENTPPMEARLEAFEEDGAQARVCSLTKAFTGTELDALLSQDGLTITSDAGEIFQKAKTHRLLLTFTVGDETVTREVLIKFADVILHLSDKDAGGLAIGKYSAASDNAPLFECAYPATFMQHATFEQGATFTSAYTANETPTNTYWIDGKQIYRNVIVIANSLSKGATHTIANIAGIETLISAHGIAKNMPSSGGVNYYPLNYYTGSSGYRAGLIIEGGAVKVSCGDDRNYSGGVVVILEYTKV